MKKSSNKKKGHITIREFTTKILVARQFNTQMEPIAQPTVLCNNAFK